MKIVLTVIYLIEKIVLVDEWSFSKNKERE